MEGSHCVTGGAGADGTCRRDGTLGGQCRTAGASCDEGLGCSTRHLCVAAVADGMACDDTHVCLSTSHCLAGSAGTVCRRDGALDGRCRTTQPRCDVGLGCSGLPNEPAARCRVAVPEGSACDPSGERNVCATPASCVLGGSTATCLPPPYVESALPSPAWDEACGPGGQHLALTGAGRDDAVVASAVAVPFAFRFYGLDATALWPTTNGWLQVSGSPPTAVGIQGQLPSRTGGALLAPYWADLTLGAAPGSDLCAMTAGTPPARRLVLQWQAVSMFAHPAVQLTFEVVLHEGSQAIDFVYRRLEPASGAEAGLADGSAASIGLQGVMGQRPLVHAGTVSTLAGIRFTPR
jgi:hypothetical protein